MKRRTVIKTGVAALGCALFARPGLAAAIERDDLCQLSAPLKLAKGSDAYWLGADFWSNRLQDWKLQNNRIECIRADKSFEMRTVSLLTRFLEVGDKPGRLQMTVGTLDPEKPGFCGFLLGVGKGELDYRGCALAQRASGTNGGFMAVLTNAGKLEFRDFTRKDKTLAFDQLERTGSEPIGNVGDKSIILDCHLDPVAKGMFDVRLVASDAATGKELAFAVRAAVPADELRGGVMLLSSPPTGQDGARWWFKDIATGGEKIAEYPERALGPVVACLHSLNVDVLKLTAQFMPIDLSHKPRVQLHYKAPGAKEWHQAGVADIEEGFIAVFRHAKWDSSKTWDYRIVMEGSDESLFSGQIRRDPGKSKELKVALFSCITPTSRNLEEGVYTKFVPQERELGRYTHDNIVFPHKKLVGYCESHEPDLYIFCGDQFYEANPTRWWANRVDSKIDTLYRWYMFLWTFRDAIRDKPAIVLIDDHDVLQGNLWGQAGVDGTGEREEDGGYRWDKDLIRMVHRIENAHNPDAYDSTPIANNIPVTYGAFRYGGISFGVLEDRKFKSKPDTHKPYATQTGELLGARQETFLKAWKTMHPGYEKVVITASSWVCAQTTPDQKPLVDFDSNGYPPIARTRAVHLVHEVSNLILAGDQHLAMLKQIGVNDFDDGPVQFCGPAGGVFWQRWFEPGGRLPNQRDQDPNTGNFTDAFGNKVRILAVANPKITYQEYLKHVTTGMQFLADPELKSEGYGLIRINHQKKHFDIECWPWHANPKTDKQFSGWPYRVKFRG